MCCVRGACAQTGCDFQSEADTLVGVCLCAVFSPYAERAGASHNHNFLWESQSLKAPRRHQPDGSWHVFVYETEYKQSCRCLVARLALRPALFFFNPPNAHKLKTPHSSLSLLHPWRQEQVMGERARCEVFSEAITGRSMQPTLSRGCVHSAPAVLHHKAFYCNQQKDSKNVHSSSSVYTGFNSFIRNHKKKINMTATGVY